MEQLANGIVSEMTVYYEDFIIEDWQIGISVKEIDGEMHLIPFFCYTEEWIPKCRIGYYLGIKNHSSKYSRMIKDIILPYNWLAQGFFMKISDLKPELLDDGALIIEYGLRSESVQTIRKIWLFPIWTDLFDSEGKQVMIPLWKEYNRRCHPQIKAIHYDDRNKQDPSRDEITLQAAHGVRNQCSPDNGTIYRAGTARRLGFRNVVHYFQWEMIQNPPEYFESQNIITAVELDLRFYLAHLIREMNSNKKLKRILKKDVDINKMSGESMKTFMKCLMFD